MNLQGHLMKGEKYAGGKERKGNVLFNDALNTFYLRLYDVGHVVKDLAGGNCTISGEVGFVFRWS